MGALLILKGFQFTSLHGIDAALAFSILGLSTSGLVQNAFILLISTSAASVVGWPVRCRMVRRPDITKSIKMFKNKNVFKALATKRL